MFILFFLGLVQQLTERVSNMESFIEVVLHNATEIEDTVKQVNTVTIWIPDISGIQMVQTCPGV